MSTRLIEHGWRSELKNGIAAADGPIQLVCPFIKGPVIRSLLGPPPRPGLRVLTRFNLADFACGVSDIDALRHVLNVGGEVRGQSGLHAKAFVFGGSLAIVTSANLTFRGLGANAEFGCVSDDRDFVEACAAYVDRLWDASKPTSLDELDAWEREVTAAQLSGGPPSKVMALPDHGAPAKPAPPLPPSVEHEDLGWPALGAPAHLKFFGEGDQRSALSETTVDEIAEATCHWACTYPKGKRPRLPASGDTMFIGRLVDGVDTRIFGRAIAVRHVDDRDDASADEIATHPWKAEWPHYVRVHHAEFVAGTLAHGVSMNELLTALGPNAFASTQEHLLADDGGNVNPRAAIRQQAAVRLSSEGAAWVQNRLERAFEEHGLVPADELDRIGWPVFDAARA